MFALEAHQDVSTLRDPDMADPLQVLHGGSTASDEIWSNPRPRVRGRVIHMEHEPLRKDVGDHDGSCGNQVSPEPATDALRCTTVDDLVRPA